MDKSPKLPTSRLARFARYASVGMRSGVSMLAGNDGGAAAANAAKVLGSMRGLATKLGQMASYVDGLVPEHQRDAYESAMAVLRSQAPRSSPEAVRRHVETELGAPMDRLFAEWDEQPMASASIGQVHRARLFDGLEVAVKVQHEGIGDAVASDLNNMDLLEALGGSFGARQFDPERKAIQAIRRRFSEELDYALEAERLDIFARANQGDPRIHVPRVIHDRSTQRVLTTELVRGLGFDEACRASEEDRRKWAMTLFRFVARGSYVHGLVNVDPHPGNYFFHDDGHVTFIDFGCCEILSPHYVNLSRDVVHAAIDLDEAAFRKAFTRLLGTKPGPFGDAIHRMTRLCFEFFFTAPFRFTRDYVASIVNATRDYTRMALRIGKDEIFVPPSELIFVNRLNFGFFSILARLDVDADYRSEAIGIVEREFAQAV